MKGLAMEPPRSEQRRGLLTVYGLATGAAAAIPLPMVDVWVGELTRGSTMRRVALRHGVKITPPARTELASRSMTLAVKATRADALLKRLTAWSAAPARWTTSIEDGLTTVLAGVFLERYLLTESRRPSGAPIDVREARVIKECMKHAVEGGIALLVRATPRGVGRALQQVGRALERSGAEDRTAAQRLVDTTLEVVSESPEAMTELFLDRFDHAVEGRRNELASIWREYSNRSDNQSLRR